MGVSQTKKGKSEDPENYDQEQLASYMYLILESAVLETEKAISENLTGYRPLCMTAQFLCGR